ncbi:glycine cleavage system aminomethyltransferase GcvT [Gallalistipes aquisgranensis]|uniref:glycine cleavage system aminomethyltransferase GcvT n=1 Tax=Gallalistipes aquisgranensis TaxID=2779358 RepID=UPI001CF8519A|nr:glycine cleavage system aminomethyltransferase GcvT [Gallalistipes aquisgranensis]MBE5033895.1 glycine cleavage system aminomethyltransferase GcvT [Gallalistipes aquisgranensis]
MKNTPFTHHHIEAGARMAEFAGYNMPIEFTGINSEHAAVREGAGVFDVSHMGEIWVKGPRAFDFLQHVTTNDVGALYDGRIQYSALPNGRGGIVDDILVYRIDAQTYLLVVNAANIEKDWNHLCAEGKAFGLTPGKELYNASDEIAQLAVQGPLAMKIVQKMCKVPVEELKYYTFIKTEIAGIPDAILSATGYTGAGGCEIYVANEDAEKLWKALWKAGEEYGLRNIGLGARDTLRLEMGFCLYGNDIDDTTSPIEAGLGWITKMVDGKDFIDRPLMERQKAEGVGRKLTGFELTERGIPRHGYKLVNSAGEEIGHVTSGTMSPTLKVGIGMGYVKPEYAAPGTEIAVVIRERPIGARIVKTPFLKK